MTELYGHRWTSSFGASADLGHAWASALEGVTRFQLASGMRALVDKAYEWPPSAPEFRKLCLEMPGLSPESAWEQALRGECSHEVAKVAAQLTGIFELRRSTRNNKPLRQQFERNYEIVLRRLQNGEPLDGRVLTGIGHDSQKTPAELSAEHCEQDLRRRLEAQHLDQLSGQACRAALMQSLGIKRNG